MKSAYKVGDKVSTHPGSFEFQGVVVSVFTKLNGDIRYVIEDEGGLTIVFRAEELNLQDE